VELRGEFVSQQTLRLARALELTVKGSGYAMAVVIDSKTKRSNEGLTATTSGEEIRRQKGSHSTP
jgi:hypothetical protein